MFFGGLVTWLRFIPPERHQSVVRNALPTGPTQDDDAPPLRPPIDYKEIRARWTGVLLPETGWASYDKGPAPKKGEVSLPCGILTLWSLSIVVYIDEAEECNRAV